MSSIIRCRIKKTPSGLVSVIASHVPSGVRGFKPAKVFRSVVLLNLSIAIYLCGCAFQAENAGCLSSALAWQSFQSSAKSDSVDSGGNAECGLVPGKGGLGRKQKMSWKSSVGLRERMAASESEFRTRNCWFLTITQPSIDTRAYEALARYSAYAMDRLNREFNRYFEGKEFSRCSVWEYQDRGSLHCHILISSDCIHAMNIDDFRLHICKVWYRILLAISHKFECLPFRSSFGHDWSLGELSELRNDDGKYVFVDCQQVKKSVVAYLSDYLGKSNHSDKSDSKNDKREKFFPIATWCQWNKKATELFNKYSENFDLGECEPDRKKEVVSVLESLHFDILKKIPLARNTEIKKPQNPYNEGLYFIPVKSESRNLAKLLVKYIERFSHIFRPELRREIVRYEEQIEPPEWTLWDLYESFRLKEKNDARKLFFAGLPYCEMREKMLELSLRQAKRLEKIKAFFESKPPLQLKLDLYGLSI